MGKEEIVVPVIDLANFPTELEKLSAAATKLGCFRVINHGIPLSLLADMKDTTRSLFQIPEDLKLRNVTQNLLEGGYVPLNYIPEIPFFESFGIHDASSPADVHSFCSLSNASPHQREIITDYFEKLHAVMMDIASRVAESQGLVGYSFKEWPCHSRLNSYKFSSQDIGRFGLPLHTDSSFMTVLQDDDSVQGLEILDTNGTFISIDPVPGTLCVIIGDVGKAWSNGRLQNVKHRVVCKKALPRITISLFLLAPKDDNIEAEPAFIDADHPKLYQNYIYSEYRKQTIVTGLRAGEMLSLLPKLPEDRRSSSPILEEVFEMASPLVGRPSIQDVVVSQSNVLGNALFPLIFEDQLVDASQVGLLNKASRKNGKPALYLLEEDTNLFVESLRFTLIGPVLVTLVLMEIQLIGIEIVRVVREQLLDCTSLKIPIHCRPLLRSQSPGTSGNPDLRQLMGKEEIVVPVIDLANFPTELEKLSAAATKLGCFRVINHGIPLSLLADMKDTTRSLFQIPEDLKLRNVTQNLLEGGYVPLNYIPEIPFFESFGIHDASSPADVHSFCSLSNASLHQREIITDYFEKLHAVMMDIASRVAESQGLVGYSFKEWPCHSRLISYKFSPEDIGRFGLPVHTDSCFMTVLQDDDSVEGLEIMDTNGNFISIDPVPGTLCVIIGDVGKAWSNGRLQNVKHRVVCKKALPRITISLFLLAPKDDNIEAEPAFIDADHPKLYQNYIYSEYRMKCMVTGLRAGEILSLLQP
ncbi:uncharacterized protein LOC110031064 [Phalaenopsis equestris]|uniref:uncharacterized protein LOC110031064 n=1 Tax=Phalaenopsis equestris TaxID=78828 RepID=UPI0009E2ADFE|nr:uncharacterized protein LOC110031064 [Phalaenopsis equestris]